MLLDFSDCKRTGVCKLMAQQTVYCVISKDVALVDIKRANSAAKSAQSSQNHEMNNKSFFGLVALTVVLQLSVSLSAHAERCKHPCQKLSLIHI